MAGNAGRLDHGARPRGLLRRDVRRVVRVAAAVPAVRGAVLRPAPPLPHAARRPARAAGRLRRLALLLQQGRDRDIGAARVSGARVLPRPHAGRRASARAAPASRSCPSSPTAVLVAGIVLLGGFRIGLDLVEGKVGDVGYGSAIGATRIQDDEPLYVDSGEQRPALRHLRTRSTTSPTTRSCGSGSRRRAEIDAPDDYELPAARAATLVFDALHRARAVPARHAAAARARGAAARGGARVRVGELPVHAVPADDEQQRHADLDAGRVRAAGAVLGARARRDDRARRCGEVRAAGARAAVRDRAR